MNNGNNQISAFIAISIPKEIWQFFYFENVKL